MCPRSCSGLIRSHGMSLRHLASFGTNYNSAML